MNAVSRSGPIPYRPLPFVAFALLFLTACATTRVAEEAEPSDTETVEVGYGMVSQSSLGESVATVHGKDAYGVYFTTLADMLRRVPGVRVIEMKEGGMTVRIRGASSFRGGEEPLFVMDGMVIQSAGEALYGVNPNNIESITVLKNADATAVYGSRGANGVILIRTKKG